MVLEEMEGKYSFGKYFGGTTKRVNFLKAGMD